MYRTENIDWKLVPSTFNLWEFTFLLKTLYLLKDKQQFSYKWQIPHNSKPTPIFYSSLTMNWKKKKSVFLGAAINSVYQWAPVTHAYIYMQGLKTEGLNYSLSSLQIHFCLNLSELLSSHNLLISLCNSILPTSSLSLLGCFDRDYWYRMLQIFMMLEICHCGVYYFSWN